MQIITLLLAATFVVFAGGTPAIAADTATKNSAAVAQKPVVHQVDAAAAEKLVNDSKVIVLDVRTPKEFREGHIQGATNLNFNAKSFDKELGTLDKSRPYLVHCAAGGRSSKAVKTMQELGFTNIYHLEPGMKGWEKAGKPTVKE